MITNQTENLPWLIFKLQNNCYAIKSNKIVSISMLDNFTPIVGQNDNVRGVIKHRDKNVPLLDLRLLLGNTSLASEIEEFTEMITQRKNDHLNWIVALEHSVETNSEFKLATDPHKCAFGKWYDSYKTENQSLKFHLNKIDEPHQKHHNVALLVLDKLKNNMPHEAKRLVNHAKDDYVANLVTLLDDTIQIYASSTRELVVIIEYKNSLYGFIVDKVLAVEEIQQYEDESPSCNLNDISKITGFGKSKSWNDLILLLNEDNICSEANNYY